MPSNILAADTSFPQLTDQQTTDEKFSVLTNYLYMLLEQLRYSMANLGRENFNDTAFQDIANLITEPVYVQLEDVNGNIASLYATAESLTSRMSDAEGNISVLQQTSTSLTSRISDAEGNISVLQQTSQSLTSRISNAEGNISSLTQTVNGFTLEVSNGSTSSVIRLLSGSAEISSQTIQMNGLVTFTGLANGTTTINGGCIKTGLIDADRLNLTGAITFSDLSSSVQDDIDNALYTAQDAYNLAYDNQLPTYIKSTYIDSARIESPEIYAGEFYGNEFNIYPESGDSGSFNLYNNFRGGTGYHILEISYWEELAPYVRFDSPASAYAQWAFPSTQFFGNLDFSGANVSGLTMSSRSAVQPQTMARAAAEKPAKTVELLVGDDGRLEVVLPDGTTWYLDENGWTKG